MREKILVDLLMENKTPISLSFLVQHMGTSESTIRKLIKSINLDSEYYGFSIRLQRGKGYTLTIEDNDSFLDYRKDLENEIDIYNIDQRLEAMLFHILQADGYITIEELMDLILVSRSTISKDLFLVEEKLKIFDLKLARRPHYGLKVAGTEQNFRKAFSKYVLQSNLYIEPTRYFKEFLNSFETDKVSAYFRSLLAANDLNTTEVVFENLLIHLKIILFRATQQNYIKRDQLIVKEIESVYYRVANELAEWIELEFTLALPKEEIQFLAAHISAKTSTPEMNPERKQQLFNDLRGILYQLDKEFLTTFFKADSELIEGLIMHIYPLLDRLYYNLQLENPLLDELKLKYTNVLVVAFRFGELIEEKYGYTLTRDEVGYIALHLAAHFEREKQDDLDKVKRIVVICSTGGGSAHLIRLKLEKLFPQALILTVSNKNLDVFKEDLPDLFLSTIPIDEKIEKVPVLQIKNFLDETELKRIMDKAALQISERKTDLRFLSLRSLFSRDFFQILDRGSYENIILEQATKMAKEKVASENFPNLVLEREEKFSTIYDKGIAGPHPIKLDARKNTIGVTILKEPIRWQGKEVRLIFLINLKPGHLFLHKEISKLLTQLMDNELARNRLLNSRFFDDFLEEIEKLI